ncbi:isochorismatase [Colletotrichum paranaense]|uniref:Isochorismatase n=5 Tax=Colletotrichum acutatum species complex TaxID=2707335 RepID=A0AAJ0E5B6_9PEZI|nr:isochorismatase [Colletotrichum costaricense]XP_060341414.1 isochorismatase [Colletotrichum paranaense]XP_060386956.1 isochorismatase [Colletotrichum tamarilloi]KAK0378485.1 isochorismatase [Colletotrichum limetticola]KAK1459439.1 isochorismatase [Colletotrichum melonis]KAK1508498.1 isochorismatase [Colletotrichum tamarilloi]KAK1519152.1 isochorismatase [Colletotrichum paranaense]KAK1534278.1 isochorismatase [Colletotrichum costaricense]
MKFSMTVAVSALFSAVANADAVPWERLNKNDSMLLVVDMQEGLFNLARDFDPTLYRNSMLAHSSLAKVFDLPVVLTTSAETGPNGPLPQEILDMHPTAPLIKRNGEVDAWDNSDFRDAVRAANKSQIILAGITTDVCTTFLALSLRAEGYSVWANVEASGTTTELIRDVSNDRMAAAGVQVVSLFSISLDLMRDWRNTPGALELFSWLDTYYPAYGYIARGHRAAVNNGSVSAAQETLPL